MEIELSEKIQEEIKEVSKELGLTQKEVIALALNLYLKNLKQYTDLQEELKGWEQISTEDTINFFEKHNL